MQMEEKIRSATGASTRVIVGSALPSGNDDLPAGRRVTLAWIAGRLRMGSKTHLAHLLCWEERAKRCLTPIHDALFRGFCELSSAPPTRIR